jgi:hypothetical protein
MEFNEFSSHLDFIVEEVLTYYIVEIMRFTDEEMQAYRETNFHLDIVNIYDEWQEKIYDEIFYNQEIKAKYKYGDNDTFPLRVNSWDARMMIYNWHLENNREVMENNLLEEELINILPVDYLLYILDGVFGNTPDLIK